jgi:hypothetical protein
MNLLTLKNFVKNDFKRFLDAYQNKPYLLKDNSIETKENMAKFEFLLYITSGINQRLYYMENTLGKYELQMRSEYSMTQSDESVLINMIEENYDYIISIREESITLLDNCKSYREYIECFNYFFNLFDSYYYDDLYYLNEWLDDYKDLIEEIENIKEKTETADIILNQINNRIDIKNLSFFENVKRCLRGEIKFESTNYLFVENIERDETNVYLDIRREIVKLRDAHIFNNIIINK